MYLLFLGGAGDAEGPREKPRYSVGSSKKREASLVLLEILGEQWCLLYFMHLGLASSLETRKKLLPPAAPDGRHSLCCFVITLRKKWRARESRSGKMLRTPESPPAKSGSQQWTEDKADPDCSTRPPFSAPIISFHHYLLSSLS